MALDTSRAIRADYTNWRGERRLRSLIPLQLHFGYTPHHPEPQWLLHCHDIEDDKTKEFALLGFHNFEKYAPLDDLALKR